MSLLSINVKPSRATCWVLSWLLFSAGIGLYFYNRATAAQGKSG